MYYPFDSRNTLYKSKFGAIASGETLELRLLLHADAHVYEAFLCIMEDGKEQNEIKLEAGDWLDGYRFWRIEISLSEGLYFYRFRYTSEYGEFFVTAFDNNVGHVSSDGRWWQLTCYEKDYATPNWLKGGIIYQIFPDRFYNSGKAKNSVPDDRFMVDDWLKQPEYRQNNGPCSLSGDYYGGDLEGIRQKLPYIASLGVSCIYLNPIFEAHSNHRYNTADYKKIDPLLGDEEDLKALCLDAEKLGIHIILDGVFSHTGDDSIYFNKKNRYQNTGAFNSQTSKYHSWFKFKNWPHDYHAWWGVLTLPETNEEDPSFNEFVTGEDGVIRHWMKQGVKGWRLDVADELPDSILDNIRSAIKKEDPDGFLLGEVWEDATNKISHGGRRRYLRGRQLDSVMNYPFADAIVKYVKGGDGKDFIDEIMSVLENYPKESIDLLMNHLGTHDTARILTRLGTDYYPNSRAEQSVTYLSDEQKEKAIKLLKIAAVVQYTLPGVPSLFYADEAGVEGYGDPFCRGAYPWGDENSELLEFYKWLGTFRKSNKVFANGKFIPVVSGLGSMAYIRKCDEQQILIAVNRWKDADLIEIPEEFSSAQILYGNRPDGKTLKLESTDFAILKLKSK